MKEFLEKNYKWIVGIFVFIWIFFILKLWLIWSNTWWCGGWWISICIVPSFEYYWISAWYIAVIFLWISIYLINRIKKSDNKIKKIQIAFLILILWLIWKPLFFLVSPDFKFYLNDAVYKDSNNNLVDIDKYLEEVNKYCNNVENYDFYNSVLTMCSWKFENDFATSEEYIKVLESAKKNNFAYLYYLTYRWIWKKVSLEEMIEKYNDDTFYVYVIFEWSISLKDMELLKKHLKNKKILELYNYFINSIIENKELIKIDKYHNYRKYWENYNKELKNKIKQIPEINNKIF